MSLNSLFGAFKIPERGGLWTLIPPNPSQLLQCLILHFYTSNASPSFLCPQPTLSISPTICHFPTWQIASLNSGWQALTRLQYKCSCWKWHQPRWRTKSLWLQSGKLVPAQKGFHTTPVNNNNHLREEKGRTTRNAKQAAIGAPFFFWCV